MDNFLQLVPMEADADDSDSALVYGDEDELTDAHDAHDGLGASTATADDSAAQYFAPLAPFVAMSTGAAPGLTPPVPPAPATATVTATMTAAVTISPEQQRTEFLQLLVAMESDRRETQRGLDTRLDAMCRIRAIDGDSAEQLAAYVALLAHDRQTYEAHTRDVLDSDDGARQRQAAQLLQCARQLSDPRDAEAALLAAFVFLGDTPDAARSGRHQSARSTAPAIAALLVEHAPPHPF